MSVADKLVEVAENTPKVCEAVQSAKTELNGTVVVAHDVSTVEHPLGVKLTNDSEEPTDFSSVTVKQNGKNQANVKGWTKMTQNCIAGTGLVEGDSFTIQGLEGTSELMSSAGLAYLQFHDTPVACTNETISVSLYVTLLEKGKYSNVIRIYVATNNHKTLRGLSSVALPLNERTKITFSCTPTFDVAELIVRLNNNKVKFEMDTLQIEYGYEPTEFEAYKTPKTYAANADGTVDGITSIAPSMVLVSSNKEAVINCRYFPVSSVGVRAAYAELVQAETALKERLLSMLKDA